VREKLLDHLDKQLRGPAARGLDRCRWMGQL